MKRMLLGTNILGRGYLLLRSLELSGYFVYHQTDFNLHDFTFCQ
jgi:hypothetical protein